MAEDFYGSGKNSKKFWFLFFLIFFIVVVSTSIIFYFTATTTPTLRKDDHFNANELLFMNSAPAPGANPTALDLSKYNAQVCAQLLTVDLVLVMHAAKVQAQLGSFLAMLQEVDVHRAYLFLTFSPLKSLTRFTPVAADIKAMLKRAPTTLAQNYHALGTCSIKVNTVTSVTKLDFSSSNDGHQTAELFVPFSKFKIWSKDGKIVKLAGHFVNLEEYLQGSGSISQWSYCVFIAFDGGANRYICKVEWSNSQIDTSFTVEQLADFLLLNSIKTSGSMKMSDGKVEFKGSFSGILPKKGSFTYQSKKKENYEAEQVDVDLEGLYRNELSFFSRVGKTLERYNVDSNGIRKV